MLDLKLRPYQEAAREFGHRVHRHANWQTMGLGKTPTTLQLIDDSINDFLDTERWLVVGPRFVVADAWPRQLRMWRQFARLTWRQVTYADLDLEPTVVHEVGGKQVEVPLSVWKQIPEAERPKGARKGGLCFGTRIDKRLTKKALLQHREQVHLCSWDAFPFLSELYGQNFPYQGVVFDEADFIANSTGARGRAAWHVTQRLFDANGAHKVKRVVELTGTPSANGYEQLHGQIRVLDGGARLGKTKEEFYAAWMMPDQVDRRRGTVYSWKLAPGCKEQIDQKVAEIAFSLQAKDYLSLPELIVNPIWVDLPSDARRVYDELEDDLVTQVGDSEILAPSASVLVGKLRQLANGAVYDDKGTAITTHDAKLEALEDIVEATPGPILLAFNYLSDWERIRKHLGNRAVHINAPKSLDRFREGKIKVLGMHPASGAHGIDGLQDVSSTAVWFGATYDARHWEQFNARLHRSGQQANRVVVHQILASDSIEGYIAGRALPAKIEEQEALLAAVRLRVSSRVSETHL